MEQSEFEDTRNKNKDLNQNLINIFEKIFQQDANSKVTYDRMYLNIPSMRFRNIDFDYSRICSKCQ